MFGSALLDVAIGMAFLFLLLSLIASAVQEVVAQLIQARAANLLRGIRSMLSSDTLPSGQTYLQALYNHGLVRSLYQVPGEDYRENAFREKLRKVTGGIRLGLRWLFGMRVPGTLWDTNDLWMPAYISSRVFALAMRDILKIHYGDLLPGTPLPAASAATGTLERGADPLRVGTEGSGGVVPDVFQAARPKVENGEHEGRAGKPLPVILTGKNSPEQLATQALRALVEDADGNAVKLQQNLENWYNDTMDRVSGWYKRYTQSVLLVIGLLLAMFFNVDSIKIVRALWVDKDARAALASEADAYMKQHSGAPASTGSTATDRSPAGDAKSKLGASGDAGQGFDGSTGTTGSTGATASTGAALSDPDFAKFGRNLNQTVNAYHGAVDQLLPVGWKASPRVYLNNLTSEPQNVGWRYLVIVLGWIVTAVALSYGAPFWFDTLNKFMVVRSTVKPQEKSQIEPSKS